MFGGYSTVIDDDTPIDAAYVEGDGMGKGYIPRDWQAEPYGSVAEPLPSSFLIPPSEFADRIRERQKQKAGLVEMANRIGLGVLNQGQTNYCWANGVVRCLELMDAKEGGSVTRLSPASVAAPVTNYRNVGGWGSQAHKYIRENGVAPQSTWPPNAIDRRYFDASREARRNHGIVEWFEVPARDINVIISLVLQDIPVAVAYNYWRHLVCATDAVMEGNSIGLVIDNSWSEGWGDNGRGVLVGNRAIPDEACCVRVAIPG